MYARMLQQFPLLTKSITGGLLFSAGDIITQKLIQKNQQFNWRRNFNLTLAGLVYISPALHFWYGRGVPLVTSKIFGNNLSPFMKSVGGVVFDQLLFAPILLSGFFVFNGFIQTFDMDGLKNGVKECKSKIKETMMTNWKIWPAATLINFYYLPPQYRVLFANFIGLFWNTYLSWISNR